MTNSRYQTPRLFGKASIWAKVVAPLGDAVGFIDGNEPQPTGGIDLFQEVHDLVSVQYIFRSGITTHFLGQAKYGTESALLFSVCRLVCVCVSVCRCLPVSVCLCQFVSVCLSVSLSVCLSVCPSVCLITCLPSCLSVYLSICLSVRLSNYLLAFMSVCLSVCLPACLSVVLWSLCHLLFPYFTSSWFF